MPPHPRKNAQTTAQLLEINGQMVLIDCGEGTQIQLRKLGIKFARIQHIFISHLHGDHFYGLIGLISTFRLLGRTADLHVYGPKGIKEIITLQLKLAKSWTDYNLFFHELEEEVATHPRSRKVYGGNPSTRSSGIYQRLSFPGESREAKNKLGRCSQLWGRCSRYGKPQTRERYSAAQWRLGRKPIAHF